MPFLETLVVSQFFIGLPHFTTTQLLTNCLTRAIGTKLKDLSLQFYDSKNISRDH